MKTLGLKISWSTDVKLQARAKSQGLSVAEYVRRLLDKDLESPPPPQPEEQPRPEEDR